MKLLLSALLASSVALGARAQSTLLVPEQFPTIQGAIAAAIHGDTVSVAPGDHPGPIDLSGKRILLLSRAGPRVTFISHINGMQPVVRMSGGETRDTILDGFTIRGSEGGGVQIHNGSPTIRNCWIRGNWSENDGAGIQAIQAAPLIENCLVTENAGWFSPGIYLANVPAGQTAVILNTTVTRNEALDDGIGGHVRLSSPTAMINSIVKGNGGTAPQVSGNTSLIYNSNYSPLPQAFQSNINVDPLFVDPLGDFRLLPTSPCRDTGRAEMPPVAGLLAELPSLDFDGLLRLAGASPDMGAHEYLAGTTYCFGDGSGTACPCGNPGGAHEGCANGGGRGAVLTSSGSLSVATADLVLWARGLLPGNAGLFLQGSTRVAGGSGLPFGDGLRCAGGSVLRLQVRLPGADGTLHTTISVPSTGGVAAGDTRTYQTWYRDSQTTPCGTGFNLSNGLELVWSP